MGERDIFCLFRMDTATDGLQPGPGGFEVSGAIDAPLCGGNPMGGCVP